MGSNILTARALYRSSLAAIIALTACSHEKSLAPTPPVIPTLPDRTPYFTSQMNDTTLITDANQRVTATLADTGAGPKNLTLYALVDGVVTDSTSGQSPISLSAKQKSWRPGVHNVSFRGSDGVNSPVSASRFALVKSVAKPTLATPYGYRGLNIIPSIGLDFAGADPSTLMDVLASPPFASSLSVKEYLGLEVTPKSLDPLVFRAIARNAVYSDTTNFTMPIYDLPALFAIASKTAVSGPIDTVVVKVFYHAGVGGAVKNPTYALRLNGQTVLSTMKADTAVAAIPYSAFQSGTNIITTAGTLQNGDKAIIPMNGSTMRVTRP